MKKVIYTLIYLSCDIEIYVKKQYRHDRCHTLFTEIDENTFMSNAAGLLFVV